VAIVVPKNDDRRIHRGNGRRRTATAVGDGPTVVAWPTTVVGMATRIVHPSPPTADRPAAPRELLRCLEGSPSRS
jgi:hypothetical protein